MAKMKEKRMQRIPTAFDLSMKGIESDITNNSGEEKVDKPLNAWDYIQECTERCPAYANNTCYYKKPQEGQRKRCTVMRTFLNGAIDAIMSTFKKDEVLNPKTLWRIGMHLIPLYQMLGRMKIEEATYFRVIYTDDKGRRKANPVYKEIRETLKQIETTWDKLGLGGKIGPVGFSMKPVVEDDDDLMDDYYERMAKGKK